jgi:thiamine-monophosphate kinase
VNIQSAKEFEFIRRLTAGRTNAGVDVLAGIGDDAAVVKINDERCLLFTCDAQVEDIHFTSDIDPVVLGRRLAAVNLSDIAAMGGNPLWALSSVFVPGRYAEGDFMDRVYDGLYETLAEFGAAVIGGNVSGAEDKLAMDLFLAGDVIESEVLKRDGAKPGQIICVTGTSGDSSAGLMLILNDKIFKDIRIAQDFAMTGSGRALIKKHLTPKPRISTGTLLARSGAVGACIDISDGLVQDASHIAAAGGVSLLINADSLPVSQDLKRFAEVTAQPRRDLSLFGGEDYELLFTVDADRLSEIIDRVGSECGVAVTAVGTVKSRSESDEYSKSPFAGVHVMDASGRVLNLSSGGFDHFKERGLE